MQKQKSLDDKSVIIIVNININKRMYYTNIVYFIKLFNTLFFFSVNLKAHKVEWLEIESERLNIFQQESKNM